MAGYQYGTTRTTPAGQLRSVHDQIESALQRLEHYQARIAAVKKEDARVREAARRNRIRVIKKEQRRTRPSTPEEFQAEAQAAYDKAMRLHPDNAEQGRFRRAAVMAEVRDHEHYGRKTA